MDMTKRKSNRLLVNYKDNIDIFKVLFTDDNKMTTLQYFAFSKSFHLVNEMRIITSQNYFEFFVCVRILINDIEENNEKFDGFWDMIVAISKRLLVMNPILLHNQKHFQEYENALWIVLKYIADEYLNWDYDSIDKTDDDVWILRFLMVEENKKPVNDRDYFKILKIFKQRILVKDFLYLKKSTPIIAEISETIFNELDNDLTIDFLDFIKNVKSKISNLSKKETEEFFPLLVIKLMQKLSKITHLKIIRITPRKNQPSKKDMKLKGKDFEKYQKLGKKYGFKVKRNEDD